MDLFFVASLPDLVFALSLLVLPNPAPHRPSFVDTLLLILYASMAPRSHSIVLLLSCNPPFLLSPIYVFREILRSSAEDQPRVQTPASTLKPIHFIPFYFQSEF